MLARIVPIFEKFRAGFGGKASPVQFWWGSFDLAVTRFSGRSAPSHPGGVPGLPDRVTREAYSHEESSAGFWPGNAAMAADPIFYSYAYPEPDGFRDAAVTPGRFDTDLGEYVLPYAEVATAADPEATLLAFLNSTYAAAADLAHWDRAALDRSANRTISKRAPGSLRTPFPCSCPEGLRRLGGVVLGQRGLRLGDDRREGFGFVHRNVGQDFPVQVDVGELQRVDELAVGQAFRADRRVDALDPQGAEDCASSPCDRDRRIARPFRRPGGRCGWCSCDGHNSPSHCPESACALRAWLRRV